MSSNLQCIGLDVSSEEQFNSLMGELLSQAHPAAFSTSRFEHRLWTDRSGAAIAFHLDGDELACITPFFIPSDGLSRWRVSTTAPTLDDCEHCSGADCDLLSEDGELVTRSTIQWLCFAPYRRWLAQPRTFELEVVAFSRRAQFFATEAAFEAAQSAWLGDEPLAATGKPMRYASTSFLPMGMFDSGSDVSRRATVAFAGQVRRIEPITNSVTGMPFRRVRVETLPGVVDVVLPHEDDAALSEGAIAWIEAWLVGRPAELPEPQRPGLLRRLFS